MTDSSMPDISTLLERGPLAVKKWLAGVEPGNQLSTERFNWLGLAEAAASNARSGLDLDWADVAISLYSGLARKLDSDSRRESLMYSQMNLRAFLIARLGSVSGHPILDPQTIIDWFRDALVISAKEASAKAAHWPQLDLNSIRELRRIKNRLSPIRVLEDANVLPAEHGLGDWLSIREQLP